MREGWERREPSLEIDAASAEALLHAVLPGARVTALETCRGGLSNSNIRVRLAGPPGDLLLRFYQREPGEARKEAALAALLEGRVPVARFLHLAETNPVTAGPYAILEWCDGELLSSVVTALPDAELEVLGRALGGTLAAIHAVRFAHHGFFALDLALPEPIDLGREGQLGFLRTCLLEEPGRSRVGAALAEAVVELVETEGRCLDDWLEPPCLAHADFNPSNILVRRDDAGAWQVTAVLDWEFALAGTPGFDFGNILRPPLGARAGFETELAEGYRAAGGRLPEDWRRIARLTDLTAWADFVARPGSGSALIADARQVMEATLAEEGRRLPA